MKSILPFVCVFSLLACAAEDQIPPKSAANEDGMICKTERPTGSGVSKRVCRSERQIAGERDMSQRMADQTVRAGQRDYIHQTAAERRQNAVK